MQVNFSMSTRYQSGKVDKKPRTPEKVNRGAEGQGDKSMEYLFTESQESVLLDTLYFAPYERNGWQQFLQNLVQYSDSRSARLLVLNQSADKVLSSTQVNTDEKAHQVYVEHFVNRCPWRPELARKTSGSLYSTYLDFSCDQKGFYHSEFFNDWAKPLDIHHGACGTVWKNEDSSVQLLIQRTSGQGYYKQQEMRALNALLPHVRRALRLETLAAQQQKQGAMLLINAQGKVVYLSPEARHYMDESCISVRNNRLQILHVEKQSQLCRLLKKWPASHHDVACQAGGSITLERPGKPALRLLVVPLHPQADRGLLFPSDTQVAIYISEVAKRPDSDQQRLCALLGLTAAEARVASLIAQGKTLQEIPALCGISIHTVRTQLKSVFRKTDASSQAQLTRMILGMTAVT